MLLARALGKLGSATVDQASPRGALLSWCTVASASSRGTHLRRIPASVSRHHLLSSLSPCLLHPRHRPHVRSPSVRLFASSASDGPSSPNPHQPQSTQSGTPSSAPSNAPSSSSHDPVHERWLRSQQRAREEAAKKMRETAAQARRDGSVVPQWSSTGQQQNEEHQQQRQRRFGDEARPLRRWQDGMADLVLVAVLVTNTYICLVWLFNLSRTLPPPPSPSSSSSSSSSDSVVRVPFHEIPNSFHRLMVDHAMVSERNIDAGRYHTLVTHGFTHLRPMHLLGNMLVFVAVGRGVILAIGVKYFWLTYAAGAIAGGVASVQMDRYLAKKFPEAPPAIGLCGASGPVTAMQVIWWLCYRNYWHTFGPKSILGRVVKRNVSLPVGHVIGGLIAYNILRDLRSIYTCVTSSTHTASPVSSEAHLAAALAGGLVYLIRFRGDRGRQAREFLLQNQNPFSRQAAAATIVSMTKPSAGSRGSAGSTMTAAASKAFKTPPRR